MPLNSVDIMRPGLHVPYYIGMQSNETDKIRTKFASFQEPNINLG